MALTSSVASLYCLSVRLLIAIKKRSEESFRIFDIKKGKMKGANHLRSYKKCIRSNI